MNNLKGVLRSTIVMFLFVGFFGLLVYADETQEQKVERLIKELQDEDSVVRVNAAWALGGIGACGCGACSDTSITGSKCASLC